MMIIAAHLLGAFLNWAIQKKKDKEEPGKEKEDKNNEVTKKQKVILLWDSHMEALVLPELEKIAHFNLVAPGALRAKNITTILKERIILSSIGLGHGFRGAVRSTGLQRC